MTLDYDLKTLMQDIKEGFEKDLQTAEDAPRILAMLKERYEHDGAVSFGLGSLEGKYTDLIVAFTIIPKTMVERRSEEAYGDPEAYKEPRMFRKKLEEDGL